MYPTTHPYSSPSGTSDSTNRAHAAEPSAPGSEPHLFHAKPSAGGYPPQQSPQQPTSATASASFPLHHYGGDSTGYGGSHGAKPPVAQGWQGYSPESPWPHTTMDGDVMERLHQAEHQLHGREQEQMGTSPGHGQHSSSASRRRRSPSATPKSLMGWLFSGFTGSAKQRSASPAQPQTPPEETRSPQPTAPPTAPPTAGLSNIQYLVTGGCVFLALTLMVDVRSFTSQETPQDICQQVVRPETVLSRDHLTQILSISERTARSNIQQVIAEPYCRLSPVNIRAGVTAEREAYPLEFDPDTWLVLLYEGEEYAGFDFSFQR